MTLPGSMDRFRITELSGVARPAQAGAVATIIKRDSSNDVGGDDRSADAMIKRGAEIMKASRREPPKRAEPGDKIDWPATAKAHAAEFDAEARTRAEADGCTFEQAYAKLVGENPEAARRMILG